MCFGFPGRVLQELFPYSALFGSTVDTFLASLLGVLENFTRALREGGLRIDSTRVVG